MNQQEEDLYRRLAELYDAGDVPWDDPLPPPEVIDHVARLEAGRALDLGCGYGRATIYLAGLGWDVDGIDFIPEAIMGASERAKDAGVYARFHICQVTDLSFLAGPYDLAIDVGCCHNLTSEALIRYRDHLSRLVRKGGTFLLFARLREDIDESDDGPGGLRPKLVDQIFGATFDLDRSELGVTEVPGQRAWRSAWYWFRRA
ncbi:MAG: class I SAM-dependent methyltransferase [Chloroflexota bacterium]|jgi:cyclopropane fatty-acyl-phospholipid synthase-like methyltransferase